MTFLSITEDPVAFSPRSCEGATFMITPWTDADWDRIGLELHRRGVIEISNEIFRATLIDELYNIYDEGEADERALLLEEFWQAEEVYGEQLMGWARQEEESRRDEALGAAHLPAMIPPRRILSARQRSRAQLLADEVCRNSQRMRDLAAQKAGYQTEQAAAIVRLAITGWSGLDTPFERVDGMIPEETFYKMKREIGRRAFNELDRCIMEGQKMTGTDAGNSGSLANTSSDETGSDEQKTVSASSGGNLSSIRTDQSKTTGTGQSSTEPAPATASDPGTATSSGSTPPADGEASNTGNGPAPGGQADSLSD